MILSMFASMHPRVVLAVLRREWREIRRNRVLLAAIAVPPVVLTLLPLAVGHLGGRNLPQDVIARVVAAEPALAGLSAAQVSAAIGLQQMGVVFLLMPAYIPLAIAAYSIVGEKQSRSLEAVLATPIETSDLLTGKVAAAWVPGFATSWIAYVALLALATVTLGSTVAAVLTGPTWLATVFALGPAVGLVSVIAGVLISSRVNDPRAAQQVGTVAILPIIGLLVVQSTGSVLIDARTYLLAAAVAAAIGLAGLRLGVTLFGRETILTRWR
jgi:ABC-2 type transport system permease protein